MNELVYATSTVQDGNMSVKYAGEKVATDNRKRFLKKIGMAYDRCVFTSLKHSEDIVFIGLANVGQDLEVDGLITGEMGVGLTIQTGDCVPLVLCKQGQVGLIHVSRINVAIVKKAVKLMGDGVMAKIGPCIHKQSYDFVDRKHFGPEWDKYLTRVDGMWQADLVGRVVSELQGIQVEISEIDTGKDLNYFSHHRGVKTGESEGRFMTVVSLI